MHMSDRPSNEELLRRALERLDSFDYIHEDSIPAIDLYMDQVTTFMDSHLSATRRREEDKVLTKAMINNYAKNDLLPPPVNKKYSKNHILQLIFIYYLKSFLSISDIEATLGPVAEEFWGEASDLSFAEIYRNIFSHSEEDMEQIRQDLESKFETAKSLYTDQPEKRRDKLQLFTFLCLIDYDIFMKKQAVLSILDQLGEEESEADKKSRKKK